jgi:hypothetical protein
VIAEVYYITPHAKAFESLRAQYCMGLEQGGRLGSREIAKKLGTGKTAINSNIKKIDALILDSHSIESNLAYLAHTIDD